jgi:hypothetical protein
MCGRMIQFFAICICYSTSNGEGRDRVLFMEEYWKLKEARGLYGHFKLVSLQLRRWFKFITLL